MRRKPVPAAHGVEFLGCHRGRRVELVDRGVELGPRPPALTSVTFGDLARGDVTAAGPHTGTGQCIGQVHVVVPAVPVGVDPGIDFGGHDQQAIWHVCPLAFLFRGNVPHNAMTAEDIIWSFTCIMDGSKGYPGVRYVRLIKGALEVEKGQAKEISGLKKIDDFTLEMTITDRVEPGYYFFDGTTAILPKEEVEKGNFANNPVGLGPFKFKEHIPGSRVVVERWEKFYKPGKPYADRIVFEIMAEAAARDVAFRNKEIDTSILGPAQYVAYLEDPQLSKGILEAATMLTRSMRMNPAFKPFADKRVRQAVNYAI